MNEKPQNITSEVVRDFPGRFVLEIKELERLLKDIKLLLDAKTDSQNLNITFWVRLSNGVLYSTNNFETLLQEENSIKRPISLLIIFGELFSDNTLFKRIVVQFSRTKFGKNKYELERIESIGGESFNLNYHGMSYRVRDKSREAALDIIDKLEVRLEKFKKWYSRGPIFYDALLRKLFYNLLTSLFLGMSAFCLSLILPPSSLQSSKIPLQTIEFLRTFGYSFGFIAMFTVMFAVVFLTFNWMLPPSAILIGDEIEDQKKRIKIREFVFVTIILGVILGVLSNYIFAKL